MKKMLKNTKGVTMTALVLTVIVLLVLAGVVLRFTMGDNGILKGALRGRIMNRVQSLDDTIKAYSLKTTNDDYSTTRKDIRTLIDEHILFKINMTDERSLYYVSNNGLQLLGLKFRGNEFNINQEKLYTDEELMQMGIYVVDNSLNAAYLDDGQVYGKLLDYGLDLNNYGDGMYNGKVVNIIPKQLIDSAQEVIVILDSTSSMQETIEGNSSDGYFPINRANPLTGYYATRLGETRKAMDALVDSYLTEGNTLKKLTIFSYYGNTRNGFTVTCSNDITENEEAKEVYQSIYSPAHYEALCKNFPTSNTLRLQEGYNRTIFSKYNLPNTKIGQGTCTPEAMRQALVYINSIRNNGVPVDVIIMSDGESNQGTKAQDTQAITNYANQMIATEIAGRNIGLYAVGLTDEASEFKSFFGSALLDSNYYSATEAGALAEAFKAIIAEVNQKDQMTIITTGKLMDEYENVVEVKIDIYSSENSSVPHRVLDFVPSGDIYDLSKIYSNNKIDLEYAFKMIDDDPGITVEHDTIDVNILYK